MTMGQYPRAPHRNEHNTAMRLLLYRAAGVILLQEATRAIDEGFAQGPSAVVPSIAVIQSVQP